MYTSDFKKPCFFGRKLKEDLTSTNVQKSNLKAMYVWMHHISFAILRWMFNWWQTQHLSELVLTFINLRYLSFILILLILNFVNINIRHWLESFFLFIDIIYQFIQNADCELSKEWLIFFKVYKVLTSRFRSKI